MNIKERRQLLPDVFMKSPCGRVWVDVLQEKDTVGSPTGIRVSSEDGEACIEGELTDESAIILRDILCELYPIDNSDYAKSIKTLESFDLVKTVKEREQRED